MPHSWILAPATMTKMGSSWTFLLDFGPESSFSYQQFSGENVFLLSEFWYIVWGVLTIPWPSSILLPLLSLMLFLGCLDRSGPLGIELEAETHRSTVERGDQVTTPWHLSRHGYLLSNDCQISPDHDYQGFHVQYAYCLTGSVLLHPTDFHKEPLPVICSGIYMQKWWKESDEKINDMLLGSLILYDRYQKTQSADKSETVEKEIAFSAKY